MAYQASLAQQEAVGNIGWMVDTLDGLALAYLGAGQPDQAKATFQEALHRLAVIEGEPGYQHLWEMITGHLEAAATPEASDGGRRTSSL